MSTMTLRAERLSDRSAMARTVLGQAFSNFERIFQTFCLHFVTLQAQETSY